MEKGRSVWGGETTRSLTKKSATEGPAVNTDLYQGSMHAGCERSFGTEECFPG